MLGLASILLDIDPNQFTKGACYQIGEWGINLVRIASHYKIYFWLVRSIPKVNLFLLYKQNSQKDFFCLTCLSVRQYFILTTLLAFFLVFLLQTMNALVFSPFNCCFYREKGHDRLPNGVIEHPPYMCHQMYLHPPPQPMYHMGVPYQFQGPASVIASREASSSGNSSPSYSPVPQKKPPNRGGESSSDDSEKGLIFRELTCFSCLQ